jgi:hypothetical protein
LPLNSWNSNSGHAVAYLNHARVGTTYAAVAP